VFFILLISLDRCSVAFAVAVNIAVAEPISPDATAVSERSGHQDMESEASGEDQNNNNAPVMETGSEKVDDRNGQAQPNERGANAVETVQAAAVNRIAKHSVSVNRVVAGGQRRGAPKRKVRDSGLDESDQEDSNEEEEEGEESEEEEDENQSEGKEEEEEEEDEEEEEEEEEDEKESIPDDGQVRYEWIRFLDINEQDCGRAERSRTNHWMSSNRRCRC
jgi:archaellum component FlaD/FlaE